MAWRRLLIIALGAATFGCSAASKDEDKKSATRSTGHGSSGSPSSDSAGSSSSDAPSGKDAKGSGSEPETAPKPGQTATDPVTNEVTFTPTDDLGPDFAALDAKIAPLYEAYGKDLVSRNVVIVPPGGTFGVIHANMGQTSVEGRALSLSLGPAQQIISLQDSGTNGLGELIPAFEFSSYGGEFVDWVIQGIFVYSKTSYTDPALGVVKPAIMQQAGANYSKPGGPNYGPTAEPTWSPVLWEKADAAAGSHAAFIYPIPDTAYVSTSNLVNRAAQLLQYQEIKLLGAQVIQVSGVVYSLGPRVLDRLSLPWGVYARDKMGLVVIGNPTGAYENDTAKLSADPATIAKNTDTTSWLAMLAPEGFPNARGLAVIGGVDGASMGNGVFSLNPGGTTGLALEVVRNPQIPGGKAVFYRYFLVADYASNLQARAIELSPHAVQGFLATQDPPALKAVCEAGGELKSCAAGDTPRFYAFASWVEGAKPLLKLRRKASGEALLTHDPYAVSESAPFDGSTEYKEFLGWAPTADPAKAGVFTKQCFKKSALLHELVPSAPEGVWVLETPKATPGACP